MPERWESNNDRGSTQMSLMALRELHADTNDKLDSIITLLVLILVVLTLGLLAGLSLSVKWHG